MSITATLAAVLALAGTAQASYPARNFSQVTVAAAIDVTIVAGKPFAVSATGRQQALDHLDVVVEGDTLLIRPRKNENWGVQGVDMNDTDITVALPSLKGLTLVGSGDIDAQGIDARALSVTLAGSGDIKASGKCDRIDAKLTGSGKMDLANLKCTTARGTVAGSGDMAIYATRTVTATATGSGDIVLYGPAKAQSRVTGSGTITRAN